MRRLIAFVLLLAVLSPASAFWQSRDSNYNNCISTGCAVSSYTGPGDIVSGATAWGGLRAYNAALAGAGATTTPVIDVYGVTTTTSCTIYLKGDGTGGLDLSTAGTGGVSNQCLLGATTFCTVTNSSCTISKLYDQSGNGRHLVQVTTADQPTLLLSGCNIPSSTSLPCFSVGSASIKLATSSNYSPNTANQVSFSVVSLITTGSSGNGAVIFGMPQNYIGAAQTNEVTIETGGGGCKSLVVTQNVWHTAQGAQPTGTSTATINADGTEGTATCAANHQVNVIEIVSVASTTMYWAEGGMWDDVAFTLAQRTNLCGNEATYYGTTIGAAC